MFRGYRIAAALAVALAVEGVRGSSEPNKTFQWKFGNNFIEQEFQECQTLPVVPIPLPGGSSAGVPPYYVFAFEVGGIPTSQMVGSDPNNLTWVANHKRDTKLMLIMTDSLNNTGGIPGSLYTMLPGSDTSCLPPAPSTPVASVHPNVTSLVTCDPWGLTIKDGVMPYTVVLSALNSPVITNVTMGPKDDVFTFIDRADPNGQLMASVVDATGKWGISSNITETSGSTNVDCVGLVSSSKTSAEIAQEAADAAKAASDADKRRRTRLTVAICLGLGIPILLGIAVAVWLYRRHKPAHENGIWDNQDITPRPLPFTDAPQMQQHQLGSPLGSPTTKASTPLLEVTPIPPVYFDREIEANRHSGTSDPFGTSSDTSGKSPGSASTSSDPSGRYRKALEASSRGHASSSSSPTASSLGLSPSTRPGRNGRNQSSQPLVSAPLDVDIQPDIIIQHRDGGIVQELPPPYADRSAGPRAPSPIPPPDTRPPPSPDAPRDGES